MNNDFSPDVKFLLAVLSDASMNNIARIGESKTDAKNDPAKPMVLDLPKDPTIAPMIIQMIIKPKIVVVSILFVCWLQILYEKQVKRLQITETILKR